ncbi:MAG TPA: hypothetical protein DD706_19075, partial [Nitrospiraceae bacterium]|nr:hypothetical protein [Nitrospiraceae bacterium]
MVAPVCALQSGVTGGRSSAVRGSPVVAANFASASFSPNSVFPCFRSVSSRVLHPLLRLCLLIGMGPMLPLLPGHGHATEFFPNLSQAYLEHGQHL